MKNLTNSILEFWFDEEVKTKWFIKDKNFDEEIKLKFLDDYQFVKTQSIEELTKSNKATHILARIIILDQFPRNIFRDKKEAFATDKKALELAKFIVKNDMDNHLTFDELKFIYMPFMHSENLEDQNKSVELFKKNADENSLDYAIQHQEIIKKFGRFPHRNKILGRNSSTEEIDFLKQSNSSF